MCGGGVVVGGGRARTVVVEAVLVRKALRQLGGHRAFPHRELLGLGAPDVDRDGEQLVTGPGGRRQQREQQREDAEEAHRRSDPGEHASPAAGLHPGSPGQARAPRVAVSICLLSS